MHEQNKNADERLLSYFEFSFENETSAYITLQDKKVCAPTSSRTVNKNIKKGKVVKWSTSRTSRVVPAEAVAAVSHLQEGLTDFPITSTGSWRFANWAKGKHLFPTTGHFSRLCLGDKIKVGRAQQSQKEVLMRSLSQ